MRVLPTVPSLSWGDLLVLGWLFVLLASCSEAGKPNVTDPQTGYYHWESTLRTDSLPKVVFRDSVPLFTRFFDVVWQDGAPAAVARLTIDPDGPRPPLVPVVFITNETLRRMETNEIAGLATDLLSLIDTLYFDYRTPSRRSLTISDRRELTGKLILRPPPTYPELQIDCDWTASTRETYFTLLRRLRAALPPKTDLSCTIRLHQFRDREVQGIPPVDRGTLMAYNVGDLDDWSTPNSIIDSNLTAPYLSPQLDPYPLPLDLALPRFRWGAVYRRDRLAYLLEGLGPEALLDTTRFGFLAPTRYAVRQSTYFNGTYLYAGDRIRLEAPDPATVAAVRRQFSVVQGGVGRVLYFRVGS